MPRPESELQRLDVEAGGLAFLDRALRSVHVQDETAVACLAQLDLRARNEALVVVPVQERAVVFGQAHDLRVGPGLEIVERLELAVFALLEVRVDGPAVRTAIRVAEAPRDALDHLVGERVTE